MIKNRTISPSPELILNVNLQEVKINEQTILRKLSPHTNKAKEVPTKNPPACHQYNI